MIYYSAIEGDDSLEMMAHTENGDFVGMAEAKVHPEHNLIEVKRIAARYQTESLVFEALAMHAYEKGMGITSDREAGRPSRIREVELEKHWDAFHRGYYKASSLELPEGLKESTGNPAKNKSYRIEPERRIMDFMEVYDYNSLPEDIAQAQNNCREVLDFVYSAKRQVFIEDEFPLEAANHSTGENISTRWDQKKVEEVYTSGKCMFLAIALNERFGHEIQMHIDKYGGQWCVEHAWVALNDSRHFDVTGVIAKEDEWKGTGKTKLGVTKEQLFKLMTLSGEYPDFTVEAGEKAVKDAHKMIDNYLLHFHPEAATPSSPSLESEQGVCLEF